MARLSLNLSDDLAQLALNFDQFAHGGLVMDSQTVLGIVNALRGLQKAARTLENEVSRHRWNEQARCDHTVQVTVDAIMQPGSNVVALRDAARSFDQPEITA